MNNMDYEENRFGYLKELSQEELKDIIIDCEDDIQCYEDATGIAKSSLEVDRNRAVAVLDYIDKNNLIKKKTL